MKSLPKILIIEDDVNNHPLYRKVFEESGFEVVLRENADGFLPADVSDVSPDIISMDLMMGKGGVAAKQDGFQAIEQLKVDERTRDIPIIVLTNFFEENKVRRSKELGAVDFITVAGQSLKTIPQHYLEYLKDPKHYKPSHPIFSEK